MSWPSNFESGEVESDGNLLHVHDLPQLYTKPSAEKLLSTLDILSSTPPSFIAGTKVRTVVSESGIPRYLTTIISSQLAWISAPEQRDEIYASASARLAERSGRSALPSLTRVFEISTDLHITLHEPSLTGDNLGLKTWTSSLLLAKRLDRLKEKLPLRENRSRVLELGAGTGLVGIAAACLWKADVILTDLPEILSNLEQNLKRNAEVVEGFGGRTVAQALDWSDELHIPATEAAKFSVIVAADPLYSPEHPEMLVSTVLRWLKWDRQSRFVIELPLRDGYNSERADLKQRLENAGFKIEQHGTDNGYDDWQGQSGELKEVKCWWSTWGPCV